MLLLSVWYNRSFQIESVHSQCRVTLGFLTVKVFITDVQPFVALKMIALYEQSTCHNSSIIIKKSGHGNAALNHIQYPMKAAIYKATVRSYKFKPGQ